MQKCSDYRIGVNGGGLGGLTGASTLAARAYCVVVSEHNTLTGGKSAILNESGYGLDTGPGMPMVMMSGWIAADALDRDRIIPRTQRTSPNPTAKVARREVVAA